MLDSAPDRHRFRYGALLLELRIMPSTQTAERPMIIEGRTIRTIEEMLEFCLAAVAAPARKPSDIPLHIAQDMRVLETTYGNGPKLYDVRVSSAGCLPLFAWRPLSA